VSGIGFLGALKRRPDLDLAAFANHWRTTHRALMMPFGELGLLTGYVQNIRRSRDVEGIVSDLDGAPELWIRDAEALAAMAAHPNFEEAMAVDSPRFIAMPPRAGLVQRQWIHGAAGRSGMAGAVKLMLFLDAGDPGKAAAAWRAPAPILMPEASPLGLERSLAMAGEDGAVPFHGCESSWWPDETTLAAAWRRRLPESDLAALGFDHVSILVAAEEVAIAPPA